MPWKQGHTVSDGLSVASGPEGVIAADLADARGAVRRQSGARRVARLTAPTRDVGGLAIPAVIARIHGDVARSLSAEGLTPMRGRSR